MALSRNLHGFSNSDEDGTRYVNRTMPGPISEVYSTKSESYELTNGNASVQIRCNWEDRYDVLQNLLPHSSTDSLIQFPYDRDLDMEDKTPLVATGVRIEPFQSNFFEDGQAIEYRGALITITYQMMATEIRVDSTAQFMTVAPNGLFWNINNKMVAVAPEEAPGVRLSSFDMTLSHPYMYPLIKKKHGMDLTIFSYEGYCNHEAFRMSYNGVDMEFQAQTLLVVAPTMNVGARTFGTGHTNVSLKLSYNPLGHNSFFNPLQNVNSTSQNINDHVVKMYKKIADAPPQPTPQQDEPDENDDDDNNNTADDQYTSDEDYESGYEEEIDDTGTYKRVLIYPLADFKPLIEKFGIEYKKIKTK